MIKFIQGIFIELNNQVLKITSALNETKFDDLQVNDFRKKTIERLNHLQEQIQSTIDSGDLEVEELLRFNFSKYTPFYERFQAIEQFCYQPIIRYGKPEVYFNYLIARIYKEIKCNQICPFITTISNSNDYFWAFPYYNVIAVPPGEHQNLINIPDLYHEIAHFIFAQYRKIIFGRFLSVLNTHFENAIEDSIDEQIDPKNLVPFLEDKRVKWEDSWVEEFSCDLIATYLTGSAYAWTNLKITTLSSGRSEVFVWSNTHPADESRMKVIFMMLERMGLSEDTKKIKLKWQKFLETVVNPKDKYYKEAFPETLLKKLTNIIFETVTYMDLTSYTAQIEKFDNPISLILNNCWKQIFENPTGFAEWEKNTIEGIKKSVKEKKNDS